ncbi:zinc finger protein 22-like [Ochlerotatus camptorhynchus]|uniref:zinc finger protein 22-like n=1 Tax=Ochlerotatus camptorhynchus TaxID=644619 RepID=UPI0031D8E8D3
MSSQTIETESKLVQHFLSVCRLCLSEEFLEDIFELDDLNLLISGFLTIVVSEDDSIGRSICASCRTQLTEFRDFKLRCLEVQEAMQGDCYTIVEEDLSPFDGAEEVPPSEEDLILTIDIAEQSQPVEPKAESIRDQKEPTRRRKKLHHLQRIEIAKSGRKRYVYDLKEVYRNQLEKCSTCEKMIPKGRMEGHQNMHQGLRPFWCERGCESLAFHCQQLRLHHYRNTHDGELHECDVCHKSYRSKRSLNYHKKDVHSAKDFACSVCSQAFASNARLKQHMKYHNREKNHPCSKCSYSFYSNHDLKKHLRTHENDR